MIARIFPAIAVTLGSYVLGRVTRHLQEKATDAMARRSENKSSAPKDLGALDYDAETNSYRPKSKT